jgi:interferon gamma-inducible protein 30
MDVTLLPYGNARKGPDGSIQCQHGPKECTGNIWENCAIAQKPQFEDHWKFILCLEQAGLKLLNATETCARAAGMDYNLLATCAKGPEGQKLHEEAGKKTGTHGWVPWVIVDGKSIGQKFDDFVSIVCKAYEGPKPEACAEQPVTTRGFIRSCNQTHDRTW